MENVGDITARVHEEVNCFVKDEGTNAEVVGRNAPRCPGALCVELPWGCLYSTPDITRLSELIQLIRQGPSGTAFTTRAGGALGPTGYNHSH